MWGHLSTTLATVLVDYVLTVDRQTAIRIDDDTEQPRVGLDARSTAVSDVVLEELTSAHSILRGKFLICLLTLLHVRRPVCVELMPKDFRTVTDSGLFRKRLKTYFVVWLSVSVDNTNAPIIIDVKKVFYVFFILVTCFYVFNFFLFSQRFL